MNRTVAPSVLIAASAAVALSGLAPGVRPAAADDDAPAVFEAWGPAIAKHELRALDGSMARAADLRGEVVVVNFWASWCKPCKRELVHLDAMTDRLRDRGVHVMAVSIDREERDARRFVEKAELGLPVYHDGPEGLARSLDLPFLPCTVVLDAAGNVARVDGGGEPETLQAIEREVGRLVNAAAAARAEEAEG